MPEKKTKMSFWIDKNGDKLIRLEAKQEKITMGHVVRKQINKLAVKHNIKVTHE